MAISFQCACGKALTSRDEAAGKRTKCPICGSGLTIPGTPPLQSARPKFASTSGAPSNSNALEVEGLVWSGAEVATAEVETQPESPSLAATSEFRPSDLPKPTDGSMQYKVLGQKDHSATGKVNIASLELCLNEQARLGWVVKSTIVINVQGHGGSHDELVIILER